MSGVIIYLVLMLPPGSSDLPESRRATVCFLFGLASNGVYTAFSVTRQAVVSYTAFSPLPLRAVIFCCTFLGVTSTGRYPASCPMKPGLSSPDPFRSCQPRLFILLDTNAILTHCFYFVNSFFRYFLDVKASSTNKFPKQRVRRNCLTRHSHKIIKEFQQTFCFMILWLFR